MYMIVKEFAKWLQTTRWYSRSTWENYCRTLNAFDKFVLMTSHWERGVEYPHTIDIEDIEEFAVYLDRGGKNIKTINNYMFGIRTFLKFCVHKWLHVLDYRRVAIAREPENKIEALSEDGMKKLLIFMKNDQSKNEVIRVRNYAIWLVLIYWWLRVQELCDMKVDEVKENMQIVWKGGNRRVIYLNPEHIKVIELYLFLRRKIWMKSEYVFASHSPNSFWNKISRASVEEVIRTAWEKSGVWKVRPHKLRHTCATQMLEHGGDVVYIGQVLGHKNLRTTQMYLDYSNDKIMSTQKLIPLI